MAFEALYTSTAGLRATQAQIGIVSRNVANAGTVGYVKRTLNTVTTGPGNSGVSLGTVGRTFDAAALRQLRLETSGAAYTSINSSVRTQLDKLYGTPGDAASLDGTFNTFTSSLQSLAADPSSAATRASVLGNAASLASRIGTIAQGVQDLRSAMESQLSQDTTQASSLLSNIASLNIHIAATNDANGRADFLDQRDQALNALSQLLDVQTVSQNDGTVTVTTGSGVTLVDHGVTSALSFDGRGALTPEAAYSTDPSKRGVGAVVAKTPSGSTIDLTATGAIRSGSIAAALEARDTILPQAQRQLDELAAGLSRSITDKSATSTQIAGGYSLDLSSLQAGNAVNLTVNTASGPKSIILIPSNANPPSTIDPSQTANANAAVASFTLSSNPATQAANIQAALRGLNIPGFTAGGFSASASGSVVSITHTTASAITGAGAQVTVPTSASDLQSGTAFPLFVDGDGNKVFTGAFDPRPQLTGIAQRLLVNPNVVSKPSALVQYGPSTLAGDTTRPTAILSALTGDSRVFASASGIGGLDAPYTSTVSDFVSQVISTQGAAASTAQDLDQGQSVALATAQGRFASDAGVNIDEEMSKLIELQTAYSANARVLTAARDMLDTLLRI